MAKQTGPNPFTGRRGDLLGFRIGKQYYVRVISSLTAERVQSDPAFSLTMQYAGLLGKASRIASAVYRLLPPQDHGFYRKLTGMAMQLLKQGKAAEEVLTQLHNDIMPPAPSVNAPELSSVSHDAFPDLLLKQLFSEFPEDQLMKSAFLRGYSS